MEQRFGSMLASLTLGLSGEDRSTIKCHLFGWLHFRMGRAGGGKEGARWRENGDNVLKANLLG